MSIKITKPIVSVEWLFSNLENKNLIILNCTIPNVSEKSVTNNDKIQIKGAIFFDIKHTFSDNKALFPNTVLSAEEFQKKAQELGVNNDSIIICYDNLGIYSAPRVWWNFKLMGFDNIAVLDGGFPKWKSQNYPVEQLQNHQLEKGNFKAVYQPQKLKFTDDVLKAIDNKDVLIADARSKERFLGTEPEPRSDVKRGHIPNSVSLPFDEILENGMLKSTENLKEIFNTIVQHKEQIIFTCGSGITASILALGAEIANVQNYSVYDGSWTEWGLTDNLPIEV